ncbi:MAG: ATP-binding cassette domain-containing protein, partial [Acidimicrobiia bacterium]
MSVLAIEGLTKSFGGFVAVDGVSLSVAQGEMRGLIGSNGAGKSTLLHLIYGRLEPDRGTIRFGDVDVTTWPMIRRARRGMGLVVQVTSIFDRMTVLENLLMGALPKDPRRFGPPDQAEVVRILE